MTPFSKKPLIAAIVLDASAILNLLGSGKPESILNALNVPCFIEERTFAEIKRHPIDKLCHKEICAALLNKSLLEIHKMSPEEYELYLNLIGGEPSECLGDGESAAIAIAVERAKTLILDDRKALRMTSAKFPKVDYLSSLQLFIAAGTNAGWTAQEIGSLVREARFNSRMNIVRGEEELLYALNIEMK